MNKIYNVDSDSLWKEVFVWLQSEPDLDDQLFHRTSGCICDACQSNNFLVSSQRDVDKEENRLRDMKEFPLNPLTTDEARYEKHPFAMLIYRVLQRWSGAVESIEENQRSGHS